MMGPRFTLLIAQHGLPPEVFAPRWLALTAGMVEVVIVVAALVFSARRLGMPRK